MGKSQEAVDIAKQAQELGFVEFTTDLLSGVYDTLVESQIKQAKSFAELLSTVSQDLADYQKQVSGLTFGASDDHTSTSNSPRLDDYIADVLALTLSNKSLAVGDEPIQNQLISHFGADASVGGSTLGEKLTVASPSLTEAELRELSYNKIGAETESQYDILRDMMRIGFARLDTTGGHVKTGLDFYVGSLDTQAVDERKTDIRNSNWYAGGSVKASFKKWGFNASGGGGASRLRVNTVSKSDFSRIKTDITFTGEVLVEFKTTVFDSVALGTADPVA